MGKLKKKQKKHLYMFLEVLLMRADQHDKTSGFGGTKQIELNKLQPSSAIK